MSGRSTHTYDVLIACPSDCAPEKRIVIDAINGWNRANSRRTGVHLQPVTWDQDGVPRVGGRAQAILNEDIVDRSDILVAIFWTRLGSRTKVADSGTVEEIERFVDSGKPCSIFEKRSDIPRDTDQSELARLIDFMKMAKSEDGKFSGLIHGFNSDDQLIEGLMRFLSWAVECLENRRKADQVAVKSESQQMGSFPVEHLPGRVAHISRFGEQQKALDESINSYLERKACLTIQVSGAQYSRDNQIARVTIRIRNEGTAPALDIRCAVNQGQGFTPLSPVISQVPLPSIGTDHRAYTEWSFGIPKPVLGSDGEGLPRQQKIVRCKVVFRDAVGEDAAIYTLVFRNTKDRNSWEVEEDQVEAQITGGCRSTRPRLGDRRTWPSELTDEEHLAVRELLRRLHYRRDFYLPEFVALPQGDNKYPLTLTCQQGVENPPHDEALYLDRDVLGILARQGRLLSSGPIRI